MAMEHRIETLERKVFGHGPATQKSSVNQSEHGDKGDIDFIRRLEQLESAIQRKLPATLIDDLKEIERLEIELHPGSLLTYQNPPLELIQNPQVKKALHSSGNQPLLFRYQDVLASAMSLKQNFQKLSQLQELLQLHMNASSIANASASSSKKDYAQAPILVSPAYAKIKSTEYQRRLSNAMLQSTRQERMAQELTKRVDQLVYRYHTILMALSQKLVLLDEATLPSPS